MDELADLYELDGAVVYRVVAYREAANSIRDSPVSVAQLAPEGRATELRNVGKTLEEKIRRAARDGRHSRGRRSCGQVPRRAGAVHALPGLGRQDGAQDLRRARHLHARGAAGGRGAGAPALGAGLGPKAEQNIASALARLEEEGPAERLLLSAVLDDRRADRRAPARASGRRPCRDRGQRAPHDRHVQGPRHHRDRRTTRPRSRKRSRRCSCLASVGSSGEAGRPGRHPQRAADRLPGGRAGPVRQRASAPDRLQAAQRGAARVRGAPRACT